MSVEENVWIARSRASLGRKYKGVLFSGLPEALNDYLHEWTSRLVTGHVGDKDRSILDIGCGYGRLSLPLREKLPGASLVGLDVSPYYAREYLQNIDRAFSVISDSVRLPFKKARFDTIFEVFSLMYLPDKETYQQTLEEMFYSLKSDGSILIIENSRVGAYLLSGFGISGLLSRVIGRSVSEGTRGLLFEYREIDRMIERSGGRVIKKTGMPLFTLLLPFSLLLGYVSPRLLKIALSILRSVEDKLQILNFLSLYHFYLVRRTEHTDPRTS